MAIETKQLHSLSKIYKEAVYGKSPEQIEASRRKKDDLAGAPLTVTNADKKANTPAWKNYKAGKKGYKAADHLKDDKDWGYDKKGNSLNPVDKMKKERKKDELFGSPKVKKESFSNWREDLKEVPNYEQIPIDAKKRNEKITEKNVKNTIKINPEMKEGVAIEEGGKFKTPEEIRAGTGKWLEKRGRQIAQNIKDKKPVKAGKDYGETREQVEVVDEKISASGYARAKKWREEQAREKDKKEQEYFAQKAKTHKWDGEKWNKRESVELSVKEEILLDKAVVALSEMNIDEDIADIIARLEKKRISKGGNPDDSPLPAMKKYHADKKKKAAKTEK